MPRDSQGLYTLPSGYNPVASGALIESAWANTTMDDLAQAMTDSLPRSGSAPMTGPLTLEAASPTQPRHATSKQYVDNFVSFSTGMPIGSIIAYAAGSAPSGFLLCNGQPVSRTTYSALFTLIGTSYGTGDGSTTFNVPNLVNQFIRGRDPATRLVGSTQTATIQSHLHPVSDPGHNHTITNPSHTHADAGHAHSISDPTHAHSTTPSSHTHSQAAHVHTIDGVGDHTHTYIINPAPDGDTDTSGNYGNTQATANTGGGGAHTHTESAAQPTINPATQAVAVNGNTTGISINTGYANIQAGTQASVAVPNSTGITATGATGDAETRPQNMAFDYYIKALQDSSGPTTLTSIGTSDALMIAIDVSVPSSPVLDIQTNVAYGIPKLDQAGKIPTFLLPAGNQQMLGLFDASTGNNPSQEYPTAIFSNGDTYIVGVDGTIDVFDPATNISAPTLVIEGNQLVYVVGSLINPDGWYYVEVTIAVASQIAYTPTGDVTSTNVQDAISEVSSNSVLNAIAYSIALG